MSETVSAADKYKQLRSEYEEISRKLSEHESTILLLSAQKRVLQNKLTNQLETLLSSISLDNSESPNQRNCPCDDDW